MNKRLLLAASALVTIATSAFAQSSPSSTTAAPTAQRQQDSTSTSAPSASTPSASSSPSSSSTSPSTSSTTAPGSTQTSNPSSTNSAQTPSPTANSQSAAGQSPNSGTNANTTQAPASSNSPSQAQTNTNQTNPPSNQAQTNQPSSTQTQSANPPASGSNQAQQNQTGSNPTNPERQTNDRQNAADRSSTNVNASVNINDQQRTRISQSISRLDVKPLNSVSFSVSVGTVVPRDVRLQQLPAEVVEVVPQYRGYDFVLVKDEIVIVEPSTYKIVATLPYSGRSTAAAPARSEERKTTFSDRDREVIRKHAKARPVEREKHVTTGSSTVRTEIRTGERVPEGVEVESFPEDVYREAPTLREYRYINRDSHTYIVEPRERRVIEEID
ncbi:MAG: DUF1236 domain-containing protein [Bradyrhizobium sp.]|nr:DUF1236 domain-containing protein [Bradyrhizobium sp.]